MTSLSTVIQHPATLALGRTLLHSLWQAGVVAAVLALALRRIPSSRNRYGAACFALFAVLAAFCMTFAYYVRPEAASHWRPPFAAWPDLGPTSEADDSAIVQVRLGLDAVLPWAAPLWVIGVLLVSVRQFSGWLGLRRLRTKGLCSAPEHWQSRLDKLCRSLGIHRKVALMESCFAAVPMVVGHFRTVVLLPVGLLSGLSVEQAELILLHELIHVRRYDYIVNVIQRTAEGILFYHPLVWWISAIIRDEREHCCDDAVIAMTHNPHAYAVALACLEENRFAAQMSVAATGGSLVKRIRRLLSEPQPPSIPVMPLLSFGLIMATAAFLIAQPKVAMGFELPLLKPMILAPLLTPTPAIPPREVQQPAQLPLQQWLEQDVVYIITDQERDAFNALSTYAERARFIEQFWERRDPTPGTTQNEFKEEHYNRIAGANERFTTGVTAGWKTDRGRIYIMFGPPDEKESHGAGDSFPPNGVRPFPFELWLYKYIEGLGSDVIMEFDDTTQTGDFRRVAKVGQ